MQPFDVNLRPIKSAHNWFKNIMKWNINSYIRIYLNLLNFYSGMSREIAMLLKYQNRLDKSFGIIVQQMHF